jgi:hypothetical protein
MSHPLLNWDNMRDRKTQAWKYSITNYYGLTFIIRPSTIRVDGSLHKFWNRLNDRGNHNANDYTYEDLCETIEYLENTFDILPCRTVIENLETGVNLIVAFCASIILNDHLIGYKNGQQHNRREDHLERGIYLQFRDNEGSEVLHKLYDKGSQYAPLIGDQNILRWERKAFRNRAIRHEIRYLSDLLDKNKLRGLLDELREDFDELMIVDTLEPDLQPKDLKTFNDYCNPHWWSAKTKGKGQDVRKRRERYQKAYHKFVRKHGLDTLKREIANTLSEKIEGLLECHVCHDIEKRQNVTFATVGIDGIRDTQDNAPAFTYPEWVYELDPDDPTRKRYRNERSNLGARIRKIESAPGLFPVCQQIQLTEDQKKVLEPWRGTDYDVLGEIGV